MDVRLNYSDLRRMGVIADDAAKLAQEDKLAQKHVNAIAKVGQQISDNLEENSLVTGAIWGPGSAEENTATTISLAEDHVQRYIDAVNAVGARAPIERQHEYKPVLDTFSMTH